MTPAQEPIAATDASFRVGEWQVDPVANELARGGEVVRLEPKAMRVLCLLAARPGGVVSREEMEAFPIRDGRYRDRIINDLRRAGLPE